MNQKVIEKAGEIIKSRANYINDGGEVATIALIDENGYPTASVKTISRAEGIKWVTFNTSLDTEAVKRIKNNNKASICINSSNYNISLTGTIEILTDQETKNENWFEPMAGQWSGAEAPEFCVLRFNTESYNIFIFNEEEFLEEKGTL